ncbi:MAG: hypothetical protein V4451_17060 [Pseudomonadota bacterium]
MLDTDVPLSAGGAVTTSILRAASSEVCNLSDELQSQILDMDRDSDTAGPCALMSAITARIRACNSLVLAFANDDTVSTRSAAITLYGWAAYERALRGWEEDAASPATSEAAFMAGRDLAINIWLYGESLEGKNDPSDIMARYRKGQPQNNFALAAIKQVIERPELAEGFAAVLTGLACTQGAQPFPSDIAKLTYAQIVGKPRVPKAPAKTSKAPARELEAA